MEIETTMDSCAYKKSYLIMESRIKNSQQVSTGSSSEFSVVLNY